MNIVARFKKVSYEQFKKDWNLRGNLDAVYDSIQIPRRATMGSAGYDFFAPKDFTLAPGESIKFPTGIRVKIENGWFLQLVPRSGLGFKYKIQLDNTVGEI